jgi:hypothetical protein
VPDVIVPLDSKRFERGQFLQKLQHGLPSVVLLFTGLGRLQDEPHGWPLAIGVAEVAVATIVIVAFARKLRTMRHGGRHAAASPHHAIDGIDLLLGLMLIIETWAHWHESGHVRRPTLLLAFVMIAVGFFHGRIAEFGRRRRSIRIGNDGVSIAQPFFRRFRATWADLSTIAIGARNVRITTKNGRTCAIDLNDLKNAGEVRTALERARERVPPAPRKVSSV